jgi:hypothetical protein
MTKRTMADVREERQAQREAAWKRSAQVRAENKVVRLMLKNKQLDGYDLIAGRLDLPEPDVVKELEAIVSRWRIDKVVRAVPGMGASRTQEVLSIFSASPRQRLGALSMERRLELSKLVKAAVEIV